MKLSRLQGAPASIRFDSRNAGATAVRVGLAATQGWGERGPSATLAGIGTDFAEAQLEPDHVSGPGATQERTCPWNKALEVRKMRFKTLLLGTAAIMAAGGSAMAADLAVAE